MKNLIPKITTLASRRAATALGATEESLPTAPHRKESIRKSNRWLGALALVALLALPLAARAQSDASLANLVINDGSLTPSFASTTFSYSDSVPFTTTSTTVGIAMTDPNAHTTVNGIPVANATFTGPISLSVGTNLISIVVVSANTTVTNTYTIAVTRAPGSSNAALASLVSSIGTISPAFATNTLSYTATVDYAINTLTVTPTVADASATVTVNGSPVASGSPSGAISLSVGTNVITTVVTAQNGSTTQTYTLTVTRTVNADLAGLVPSIGTMSPAFASGTFNYTVAVPYATTSMTVTPTLSDPLATVTVNGSPVTSGTPSGTISISLGTNVVAAVVVSADKTATNTYTLVVARVGTVIYEPFNYPAGALTGQGGTSDFGLTGKWNASADSLVAASSLSYGSLSIGGGSIGNLGGSINRFGGARAVSASALAGNGLLAPGTTVWFSIVVGYGLNGNVTNARLAFSLANNSFMGANFNYNISNTVAQVGSGIGLTLGRFTVNNVAGNGYVVATRFQDNSTGSGFAGNVFGSANTNGPVYGAGQSGLIIGKIVWGATTNDPATIQLFQPGTDLALPATPISTLTTLVDQSAFNTITWARGDIVVMDEIRFGATYQSVLGINPAYWDLNGATAGAGSATPAGTWDATSTNWNGVADGTGSTGAWSPGETAYFAAGTNATGIYTVTVSSTQNINGLNFQSGTVTLSGGQLQLGANAPVIVATNLTATVASPISNDANARQLLKYGPGTLVLSGTNTYTGSTTVAAGTLKLETNGVLTLAVADASNSKITGAGTATLNGRLSFDTSAVTVISGTWTNVDVTSKTYGPNFAVIGFTGPVGNVWTKLSGPRVWTFNQTTGVLNVSPNVAILNFGFIGGDEGVINQNALTIAWTAPYCANLASVAPSFVLSGGTSVPASGSVQDFTHGPVTYTVTDGTTTNTYVVTATQATTITQVIYLGTGSPTNNSTTIGPAAFLPLVPQGSLPVGSILRQIQINSTIVSSDQNNWAAELLMCFDPTPSAVGGEGNDLLEICGDPAREGVSTNLSWGAAQNIYWATGYGAAPTTMTDTKTFGLDWTNTIDLHSNAVFLANGWDTPIAAGTGYGSWAGTIALTYDVVSSGSLKQITSFTLPIPGTTTTIFGTNISVVVPLGTPLSALTALTPSYTFCGASCLPLASATQNFTNPVSYTVTAADASTQTYLVSVSVQLPPHTTIPTGITLSTNDPLGFVAGAGVYVEIFNNAILQFVPAAQRSVAITNGLIFSGGAGTNYLKFNGNDVTNTFSGPITSHATNAQTLAIWTGVSGNGDREEVTFLSAIPDVQNGSPYGLVVNFREQTASDSYVNLVGSNTFTGPITLLQGSSVTTNGYLTIGGRGHTTGAVNQYQVTPGSGYLGGGNYPGAISLGTNTILDYASSANQILSGVISATGPGLGALVKDGPGTLTLAGLNTFTGNITVNTNTLVLATNGGLSFRVTDTTNNQVNGKGTATLNGTFTIDTSGVVVSTNGTWPLVHTTNQSYGATFNVVGFTKTGSLWQQANGSKVWTFDTTSGNLYLTGPAVILSLGIPGSTAVINGLNIALTVPWSPWGTNGLAALAPTYTLSSGTCVPSSGVAPTPTFATQNPATYSVTDGAYNNNYTVTVTITPALTNNLMANVFFPGFGYAFPDATGTNFTLVVPGSTAVTALAPTYTVSSAAAGSPVSGTTRDFTTPQTYTVTAQSGAVQAYSVNVQKIATVKTGYQEIVLASGPISYWPLNETSGTTFFDIASGLNNMTATGFNLNQIGLRPDGVPSAYCNSNLTSTVLGWAGCSFNQSLNPATFSVECWIKVDESVSAGAQYLVSIQDRSASVPTGGRWGYSIQRNNGTGFNFSWGTLTSPGVGNFATISSTNTLEPVINTVYHVVGTYDGSTMKLYVNGVLENSASVPAGTYMAGTATDPGFSIGSRVGNTGRNCWMQDVALYGHALTQQEIQTHLVSSPLFQYTQTGTNLTFTWSPAGGTLQGSTNVVGPYTNVSGATSPWTVPITGSVSNAYWRAKF